MTIAQAILVAANVSLLAALTGLVVRRRLRQGYCLPGLPADRPGSEHARRLVARAFSHLELLLGQGVRLQPAQGGGGARADGEDFPGAFQRPAESRVARSWWCWRSQWPPFGMRPRSDVDRARRATMGGPGAGPASTHHERHRLAVRRPVRASSSTTGCRSTRCTRRSRSGSWPTCFSSTFGLDLVRRSEFGALKVASYANTLGYTIVAAYWAWAAWRPICRRL